MENGILQRQKELRRKLEEKIDQFNKQSFPASDSPQWGSLQDLEHEIEEVGEKDSTNRSAKKDGSADRSW